MDAQHKEMVRRLKEIGVEAQRAASRKDFTKADQLIGQMQRVTAFYD
jgi:hypothetical protein